jgi:hypothetical protein
VKVATLFSWGEIEAAAKEWDCSWSEALCRLLDGEMPVSALEHLLVHMFPETASKATH